MEYRNTSENFNQHLCAKRIELHQSTAQRLKRLDVDMVQI